MPRSICKQIICGPEAALSVAKAADTALTDDTLSTEERSIIEGVRASAKGMARAGAYLSSVELGASDWSRVEATFSNFKEGSMATILAILNREPT